MRYNFYFDETFHDPKITIKEDGALNVLKENTNESYIGVFWGYEYCKEKAIYGKLKALEDKYAKIFDVKDEFKSTTIGKKNFEYGIRSFNNNAYDFYKDLFEVLEEINPMLHINMVSTVELLIRNIFDGNELCKRTPGIILNSFYYSMTKFILFYHSPHLLKSFYEVTVTGDGEKLKQELVNHLEKIISATEGIKRKEREIPAFKSLKRSVSSYRFNTLINNKYDFVYFQNFDGLMNFLEEKRISSKDVNLIIDKEKNTYMTAKEYKLHEVKEVDSKECLQIRLADHLCGFVGRMMFALTHDRLISEDKIDDIEKIQENDLVRKHLLSPEWFMLNEKQFYLYKKVYKVLIVQQEAYWATMTWSYADQAAMFYSLLRYIASYESFDEYDKIEIKLHTEYYNATCIEDLERHYTSFYREYFRS